jgi:SM-20-related protein
MFSCIPPYQIRHNFLDSGLVARLLDYAVLNEARFEPTSTQGGLNTEVRRSARLCELGDLRPVLEGVFLPLKPALTKSVGTQPFDLSRLELELVAHGDGAFYTTHLDTATGPPESRGKHTRMLSAVYYFHAEPKGFAGGALRLHALGPPAPNRPFIDLEPEHNTLAVFPSIVLHEVLPVSCPSGRFIDSRFAINCWMNRADTAARTRLAGTSA